MDIALITIGSSIALWAAWNLLGDRFPHPVDLAIVSIAYYSLPLAIVSAVLGDDAGLVFLHDAAANRDLAFQSSIAVVTAVIALCVGRLLGRWLQSGRVQMTFDVAADDKGKVSIVLLLLLTQIALGIALFGVDALLAGYNVASSASTATSGQALLYLSIELVGLTVAYAYLVSQSQGRWRGALLIIAALAVIVALGLIRGKRLEIVQAFLPLMVLAFATRPALRGRFRRVLIVVGAAIFVSLLASIRLGEAPNLASLLFNLFSEGLFAGHALPGLLDKLINQDAAYEFGSRILGGLLAFVPRFLWPGKDEALYASAEVFEGVAPLGATSMLGEVYLQGGHVAVAAFFLIAGFLLERTTRFQDRFDESLKTGQISVLFIPYIVALAIFVPHFRDGIMPSIKISLQAMVFLIVLAGFHWRPWLDVRFQVTRRRMTGRHRHARGAGWG